jgi:hypothetical protein
MPLLIPGFSFLHGAVAYLLHLAAIVAVAAACIAVGRRL